MKLRKINGKEYLVAKDGEATEVAPDGKTPEVTPEVAPEVEEKPTEEAEESEEALDQAAEKAAKAITSQLPIEELSKALKALNEKAEVSETTKKVLDSSVTEKDVKSMTGKEKIVKFFQACIHNDHTSLKALSEGTAADGGYLFPKFVGA